MKRKFWNWVKNDTNENKPKRTLFLNGEISDETWYGDEVTPQLFSDELQDGEGDIDVWINSPGGDVFAAAQIYNMLKSYPGKVCVRIDSLAASAASVIAMAGDIIEMSPVAMMMVHNPSMIAIGNVGDMKKAIEMLNEVKESILNAYEAKTGIRRSKLADFMNDETWFNAKKALELGFCDAILFSNKEEKDTKEMKEEKNIQNKIEAPAPASAFLFSRKSVENSFLSKVSDSEEKFSIDDRKHRLNLIVH